MGPYCDYCQFRCFVLRVLPSDAKRKAGQEVMMATCPKGMDRDLADFGYTFKTAIDRHSREWQIVGVSDAEVFSETRGEMVPRTLKTTWTVNGDLLGNYTWNEDDAMYENDQDEDAPWISIDHVLDLFVRTNHGWVPRIYQRHDLAEQVTDGN